MVRVGLIGFGLAGQSFHAPVIEGVAGMELACILERRGSLAGEKYPKVRVARTLEELLSDETIRLVRAASHRLVEIGNRPLDFFFFVKHESTIVTSRLGIRVATDRFVKIGNGLVVLAFLLKRPTATGIRVS